MPRFLMLTFAATLLGAGTAMAQELPPLAADDERAIVVARVIEHLLAGDEAAAIRVVEEDGAVPQPLRSQLERLARAYGGAGYRLHALSGRPGLDRIHVDLRHARSGERRGMLVLMVPGTASLQAIMLPAMRPVGGS
jgi:hypothetical protein